MVDKLNQLIDGVRESYLNLRTLQPSHEILRYFTLNNRGFEFNPKREIKSEFFGRFGSLELKDFKTYPDYESALIKECFGNYSASLEKALKDFIEG